MYNFSIKTITFPQTFFAKAVIVMSDAAYS